MVAHCVRFAAAQRIDNQVLSERFEEVKLFGLLVQAASPHIRFANVLFDFDLRLTCLCICSSGQTAHSARRWHRRICWHRDGRGSRLRVCFQQRRSEPQSRSGLPRYDIADAIAFLDVLPDDAIARARVFTCTR